MLIVENAEKLLYPSLSGPFLKFLIEASVCKSLLLT